MTSIYQPKLSDIMPLSLKGDAKFLALATALDTQLEKLSGDVKQTLFLPRLDELSSKVLDLLAWQLHVDNYSPVGLSNKNKRNLIRNSIAHHRRKGTRAAVEDVCNAFDTPADDLQEWFETDDLEPYEFRLTAQINKAADIDSFVKRVFDAKNVRSWLILRLKKVIRANAYVGTAKYKWGTKRILKLESVTIEPKKTTDELNGRTFIIEPNKVTIIRNGEQQIITPILPSDQLQLKLAFPSGSRTITLNNPRDDLTADDINKVADYAIEHELLLKTDDAADDLTSARLVSITEIPIF